MMMPNEEGAADSTHQTNIPYDVFLNFCGEDTGFSFTGNLYNALCHKRLKIFMDDDDDDDNQISPSTIEAIEESRIFIVILSKNCANSVRRLDLLVRIHESGKKKMQLVWPVYYQLNPSDVRHQSGHFGRFLAKHEESFGEDKVQTWRSALHDLSNLSGWQIDGHWYQYESIQKIVKLVLKSLRRHDIFLSFSGEDTRYSFTGFLYNALRREGFKIFMDDEGLVGGDQISTTLIEAIERSRLSIIVFSENYGYSTWCLDELAMIVECMKTKNQLVWPIFYKVERSDVIKQINSYGEAMAAHEKRFGMDSEKVQKWRLALSEIANLKGWSFNTGYEYEFIQMIVEMAIDMENQLPISPCVKYEKEERSPPVFKRKFTRSCFGCLSCSSNS